jgi:FMN phosphatase YigB (HAD superfamily)
VPSRREGEQIPQYDLSKESFLEELGRGDVFLDDTPRNIEGVGRMGLKTILIPQPWNESRQSLSEALQSLTQLL